MMHFEPRSVRSGFLSIEGCEGPGGDPQAQACQDHLVYQCCLDWSQTVPSPGGSDRIGVDNPYPTFFRDPSNQEQILRKRNLRKTANPVKDAFSDEKGLVAVGHLQMARTEICHRVIHFIIGVWRSVLNRNAPRAVRGSMKALKMWAG